MGRNCGNSGKLGGEILQMSVDRSCLIKGHGLSTGGGGGGDHINK